MNNRRKLRNFLINPAFQLKYAFWLSASGLTLVSMNAALFYLYTRENYSTLVELSPMTDDVRRLLQTELRLIILQLSALSLAFVILMTLLGIVISHRAAGPLFHFNRIFREIAEGNRQARVRLRPGDDFQDVAASFNRMMDSLEAGSARNEGARH